MLIAPNSQTLGDALPPKNSKEALAKAFEETDNRLKEYRLDDHDHLKDVKARVGRRMNFTELLAKIKKINPDLFIERSVGMPTHANFYLVRDQKKICCGTPFEMDWMPEFTFTITDTADLVTGKVVGWREVVAKLANRGYIPKAKAIQMFGDATTQKPGERWHEQLRQQ